jgi:hypothetical protein
VRLSIEAARTGHLYVIDREQYADGSQGKPVLIFPTTKIRNGNNKVSAGRVIEIPDRADDPIYFNLERSRPDHVGELLTVIITPQPLAGLSIGPNRSHFPKRKSRNGRRNGARIKDVWKWQRRRPNLDGREKAAGRNPNQSIKPMRRGRKRSITTEG